MTEQQAKELLARIINELDTLDEEDFFWTEWWREYMWFEE